MDPRRHEHEACAAGLRGRRPGCDTDLPRSTPSTPINSTNMDDPVKAHSTSINVDGSGSTSTTTRSPSDDSQGLRPRTGSGRAAPEAARLRLRRPGLGRRTPSTMASSGTGGAREFSPWVLSRPDGVAPGTNGSDEPRNLTVRAACPGSSQGSRGLTGKPACSCDQTRQPHDSCGRTRNPTTRAARPRNPTTRAARPRNPTTRAASLGVLAVWVPRVGTERTAGSPRPEGPQGRPPRRANTRYPHGQHARPGGETAKP
ncbi:hypothetical protein JOF53_007101 [Crossiella equi]|uniref:Uncharacterized protein n=1 Tax=Crossiella equi TaxID=130796 RepID=A0ABS5ANR9_9PSEU|nr:hypothetical protein [Crossiella equi]